MTPCQALPIPVIIHIPDYRDQKRKYQQLLAFSITINFLQTVFSLLLQLKTLLRQKPASTGLFIWQHIALPMLIILPFHTLHFTLQTVTVWCLRKTGGYIRAKPITWILMRICLFWAVVKQESANNTAAKECSRWQEVFSIPDAEIFFTLYGGYRISLPTSLWTISILQFYQGPPFRKASELRNFHLSGIPKLHCQDTGAALFCWESKVREASWIFRQKQCHCSMK